MGQVTGRYDYQTPHYYDMTQGPLPGATLWDRFASATRHCDPYPVTWYDQDFVGVTPATNTINGWTVTVATSGTVTEDTTNPNGAVAISAGAATAGQGVNWQMSGSPFKIAANKPVAFEVYGTFSGLSTTPKIQFFAGLAEQSTALITGNAMATKIRLGFQGVSTTGVLTSVARSDSTAVTGTGVTITNAAYRLGFYATSSQVDFYVNGAIVSSSTTQIPTTAVAPAIVMQANATVTPVFTVDYIRVAGLRN